MALHTSFSSSGNLNGAKIFDSSSQPRAEPTYKSIRQTHPKQRIATTVFREDRRDDSQRTMHIQPIDNANDMEPFVIAMSPNEAHHSGAVPGEAGETFDDVWGSEPSSPTALPAGDDGAPRTAAHAHSHPSDMARLQAEHSTAGYREGVTEAKNQSIQAGFDEGFGLGAAIGARAGQILGMLEGISSALAGHRDGEAAKDVDEDDDDAAVREDAARNLSNARKELDIGRVFGPEYWNPDGTWKYDVGAGDDDGDVLFAHVADAHPLIAKWTAVTEAQVARWAIDRSVFADVADEERQQLQQQQQQDKLGSATAPQVRKPLDW